jgi:glycerol kinase
MSFQANVAKIPIERAADVESTARGAAMLAALGAGLCANVEEVSRMAKTDRVFPVDMTEEERSLHFARWRDAVSRARTPERPSGE